MKWPLYGILLILGSVSPDVVTPNPVTQDSKTSDPVTPEPVVGECSKKAHITKKSKCKKAFWCEPEYLKISDLKNNHANENEIINTTIYFKEGGHVDVALANEPNIAVYSNIFRVGKYKITIILSLD